MRDLRIVFVTAPNAQILDVTGPLEVFSSANSLIDGARYRTEVVGAAGGTITTPRCPSTMSQPGVGSARQKQCTVPSDAD